MGCKCGETLGICNSCPPPSCGCEGLVTDEVCVNGTWYMQYYPNGDYDNINSYVEFSFGYVVGTNTTSATNIVTGSMEWYFGLNTSPIYFGTSLPSGGTIVASGNAQNCFCDALNFGYDDCPFSGPVCDNGGFPQNAYSWS